MSYDDLVRYSYLIGANVKPSSPERSMVINTAKETCSVAKDVANVSVKAPMLLPHQIQSMEQQVLHQMYKVVGDKPTTEFRLQFAPKWTIDKAIHSEKDNYLTAGDCKEVDIPHSHVAPTLCPLITSSW